MHEIEKANSEREDALNISADLVLENKELKLKIEKLETRSELVARESELEKRNYELDEAIRELSEKDEYLQELEDDVVELRGNDNSSIDSYQIEKLTIEMELQAHLDQEIIELLRRKDSNEQDDMVLGAECQIKEMRARP